MTFDVPKLHKYEENLERESHNSAIHAIQVFYEVEDVDELNHEQKIAVRTYVNNMNEYSLMCQGFREVLSNWGVE